tara:strand:+ start:552 stop:815 length:264 start_codon:yes stop_codon:yes gene_type:complete
MAEKVLDKLKRLSRDLAESVRAEIDLRDGIVTMSKEMTHLKKCIASYLLEKENITDVNEAVSFIKGFHEAKTKENEDQMKFNFTSKK